MIETTTVLTETATVLIQTTTVLTGTSINKITTVLIETITVLMKTSIYRNNNCISTQATWRSFDICVNCLAAMFSLYVHAYEVYVDIVTL